MMDARTESMRMIAPTSGETEDGGVGESPKFWSVLRRRGPELFQKLLQEFPPADGSMPYLYLYYQGPRMMVKTANCIHII